MSSDKRNLFSHSSGGQESETVVLAGLIPSDGTEGESVPGLSRSVWCGLQRLAFSAL